MYPVRRAKRSTPVEAAGIRFLLHGAGWWSSQPTLKSFDRGQRNIKRNLYNMLGVVGSRGIADAVGATKGRVATFILIRWILS